MKKGKEVSSNKKLGFQYLRQPINVLLKCREARLLTVEPAIVLYLLSRTFLLSLSQQYFFSVTASKYLKDSSFPLPNGSFCLDSSTLNNYSEDIYRRVMSESNHLVAVTQVVGSLTAVVLTILSVPLLERYGYKLGIIFTALGSVLKGVMLYLAAYYHLNPYWFSAAYFVGGLSGDVFLLLSASLTYITHVSSTKWLTMRLAIGEAAACVGEGTGQLLLGFWLQTSSCSYLPLFFFYTACNVFIVIYIAVWVPVALTASEMKKNAQEHHSKGISKLWHGLRLIFTSSFSKAWRMLASLAYMFVSEFVVTGGFMISLYFLKALPLDFDAFRIGIVQSMLSYGRALSNMLLVAVLVLVKVPDAGIILLASLVSISCSILLGLSKKHWHVYTGNFSNTQHLQCIKSNTLRFYTVFAIHGVDLIGWAGAEGLMSKLLSSKEQGIY